MEPISKQLLDEIEAFLERHANSLSATAFGLFVSNNGHLVRDLRAGVDVRASTIDRARAFMSAYREDAA